MRLGIDLGGTKTEAVILGDDGSIIWRKRQPTPQLDYKAIITSISQLITDAADEAGFTGPVGMGIPGSINPSDGTVHGASTQVLNGQNLKTDCEAATGRDFRLENDANCFVLSEASDGAASGHNVVFGAILGTGCGGGFVHGGKVISGQHNITGEWGHTPLPWPIDDEYVDHDCWCGMRGCLETYLAGPAVSAEYEKLSGKAMTVQEIAANAHLDLAAQCVLQAFEDRLARALSQMITLIDPDAIVLGGGLSNLDRIYTNVPRKFSSFVFSSSPVKTPLLKPKYGDSSGVRGAAWLWGDGTA